MPTRLLQLLFATLLLSHSLIASSAQSVGRLLAISDFYSAGDSFQEITLKGALSLSGSKSLAELSGLAWDEDEQILYAVSDQGRLLHLKPVFRQDHLFDMELVAVYKLRGKKGKKLKGKSRDAEGINILNGNNGTPGDSKLLISFERDHRVLLMDTKGQQLKKLHLPAPFNESKAFSGKNNGIEGFVVHPTLGPLYSAEKPLKKDKLSRLTSERGDIWFLPTLEEGAGLVAFENSPDGGVLVLERAVTNVYRPWTITLYKVFPDESNRGELLTPTVLARINSAEGWYVQNIEGLTHYKDNEYFMVSDDGDSIWQQTQFIHFELND